MSGCGCSKETPCEDKKSQQEIIHQLQKQAIQRIVIIRLAVVVKRKKKNLHLLAVTLQTVVKIPLNPVVVLIPKKI